MRTRLRFETLHGIGTDAAMVAAESAGVCTRPHVRTVSDRQTGEQAHVPIPCGSTRETVCKPCAEKARRLRMHQCREGWHLTEDPLDDPAGELDQLDDVDELEDPDGAGDTPSDLDELPELDDEGKARRVRSTRRLPDFPPLPTQDMADVSVARSYVDEQTGATYRPSMFLTLTLPSYGRVHPGGIPRDPRRYDYRRAALDAILFPRLLDRFWQNLRRCAGYHVQYFSAIEGQRRLAPHLHAAVRGTIPRKIVKAVAAATYYAAWWPSLDVEHFDERTGWPEWSEELTGYLDPATGVELPTWDEATAELVDPAHVVSFGAQVDIKGLIGGTPDSDRAVRYLCKYLTKAVADTYAGNPSDDEEPSAGAVAYARHIDRLHAETSRLPCSPACGNWLRYGVQPKAAAAALCVRLR